MKRKEVSKGVSKAVESFLESDSTALNLSIIAIARSIEASDIQRLTADSLASEISTIKSMCSTKRRSTVFWLPSYDRSRKLKTGVIWRESKEGTKVKASSDLVNKMCWRLYSKDMGRSIKFGFKTAKDWSADDTTNEAFITSSLVDLVWIPPDIDPVLIDSFTGTIRHRSEWSQKFMPFDKSRPMRSIPFNPITLAVFGDRYMIKPRPAALRKLLASLMDECESSITIRKTKDLVRKVKGLEGLSSRSMFPMP